MKKVIFLSLVVCLGLCLAMPSMAAPSKIKGVKVKKIQSNAAKVKWTADSKAASYVVKVRRKKNKKLVDTVKTTATSAWITLPKKKKYYRVKVRGIDSSKNKGPWSKAKLFKSKGWRYYHHNKYGFSLKFPKCWKGFDVEKTVIEESEVNAIYLSYRVPTSDSAYQPYPQSGYASLFTIGLYTPAQWAILENSPYIEILGEKLDETDDYVYVYSHAQDAPTDIPCAVNKITQIKNSFKLD